MFIRVYAAHYEHKVDCYEPMATFDAPQSLVTQSNFNARMRRKAALHLFKLLVQIRFTIFGVVFHS